MAYKQSPCTRKGNRVLLRMIFILRKRNKQTKRPLTPTLLRFSLGRISKVRFNNRTFSIFSFPPVSEEKVLSAKAKGITEALWEKGCECTLKTKLGEEITHLGEGAEWERGDKHFD